MPEAARRSNDLGDFIRSRRAAAQPPDGGRSSAAGRRRVPGLRREEVAASAGVSLGYYVRLEQGRAGRLVVFTADQASAPGLARLRDIASCSGPGSTAG